MSKINIKNARLSFPSIFRKSVFNGVEGVEGKFESTFLLDKVEQADQIDAINKAIKAFLVEKFGEGKAPKGIKLTCLQDGDDKDYDGYEGKMAFKATSNRRPLVIDRDRTPLAEDDGKPYAGCYVNAIVSLWYSDHAAGGKQVLANLEGVQFFKDGEVFGDAGISVNAFDAFDDESDDDFI